MANSLIFLTPNTRPQAVSVHAGKKVEVETGKNQGAGTLNQLCKLFTPYQVF